MSYHVEPVDPDVAVRIQPGLAPNGVVLRVVLDNGQIVVEQTAHMLAGNKLLDELAEAGAVLMAEALERYPDVHRLTVAGYDGDDGLLLGGAVFGCDDAE